MRKNLLQFITFAIILLLGACSNDEIIDENNNPALQTGRTLSLTATMPGDNSDDPTTRVGLEQLGDRSIELTWEVNDELQLAFVQGKGETAIKIKSIAKVTSISDDGKKAAFEIIIPEQITDDVFDLYGVYGGGGLSNEDPTKIILPTDIGRKVNTLADIKERKDVVLYFSYKAIQKAKPKVSVIFKHLGSLFSFNIKHTGMKDINNLDGFKIFSFKDQSGYAWIYSGGTNHHYDLLSGKFPDKRPIFCQDFDFSSGRTLMAGETKNYWIWLPILPEKIWPELTFRIYLEVTEGQYHGYDTSNPKPARTTPTAVGKVFYFSVEWDGQTSPQFVDPRPNYYHVMPMGSLSTRLNQTQRDTITTMTITGEMNPTDFKVLNEEIPNLKHIDLKNVRCENNEIPVGAFQRNKNITSIVLPEGITVIGNWALSETNLTGDLIIPNSVTKIGEGAFYRSRAITGSLILPKNLTKIEHSAFRESGFTGDLIIPDGITEITKHAFLQCIGLTGTLTLPKNLTKIGVGAFWSSGFTGNLIIPNGVTEIGTDAFRDCRGFRGDLTIPNGVTEIKSYAFYECRLTGNLTLPNKLTKIGEYAFEMNSFTGDLVIPNSVIEIERCAFRWVRNFTGLTLSKNLTSIREHVFYGCKGFTGELIIPDGITVIGESGFRECGFTSVILPKSLTTIGKDAFIYCKNLTGKLLFPKSVNYIGENAFSSSDQITAFQFHSHTTPITYTNNMFHQKAIIEVPHPSVNTYKAADGWKSHTIVGCDSPLEPDVYHVPTMGTLGVMLTAKQKSTITEMIVTGQINKADFEVMKKEMPNLIYLDLKDVTCENNEIPEWALGDYRAGLSNKTITTIIFPKSITKIGGSSFEMCTGLTGSLTIPDKVITIDLGAFNGCTGFNELYLSTALKSIKLKAFYNCSGLTGKVTLPSSLEEIADEAFWGCNKVSAFRFPHLTPLTYNTYMLPAKATIEVPQSAVSTYKGATGWKNHTIVGY